MWKLRLPGLYARCIDTTKSFLANMIYVDFDGTIADVWERYYHVFMDFFLNVQNSENHEDYSDKRSEKHSEKYSGKYSLEEYKSLKSRIRDDRKLAEKIFPELFAADGDTLFLKYKAFKKQKLEDIKYLSYDKLIVSKEWLEDFFGNNSARVLTSRKDSEALFSEMKQLDIEFLIPYTVVVMPNGEDTKLNWLLKNVQEAGWMIGDSEVDIKAGKCKNIKTCFVRTGLRREEDILAAFTPDLITDSLSDFKE